MAASEPARTILISAGEASGDTYASMLVEELRKYDPAIRFFGCAGPKMRQAAVRPIIRSESLAVVGLLEVVGHLPRIYREYRKLVRALREEKPDLVILTDSPDFHLRIARHAARLGIPVFYFVAPQVWAWRKDRLPLMRRVLTELLCIFPFEAKFFNNNGVPATYVGHPLAGRIAPSQTRPEFLQLHGIPPDCPLVALLPGSRRGEAKRHLPALFDAARRLSAEFGAAFVLPASSTTGKDFFADLIFRERIPPPAIQVIEGQSWDALAYAGVALAASGTVTIEGALLGTPMVTFYKVTAASWALGKLLVRVPFYCMVNLVAGYRVVPELMQGEMTGMRLAEEAGRLLRNAAVRDEMRRGLRQVADSLGGSEDAIAKAAAVIWNGSGWNRRSDQTAPKLTQVAEEKRVGFVS